jgi:diamine N-acetyltransferase
VRRTLCVGLPGDELRVAGPTSRPPRPSGCERTRSASSPPVATSLAEAYAHGSVAWPRLIVTGDRPVGFLMAFLDIDWLGDGTRSDVRSGLWRLEVAVDARHRGFGRFAVEAVAAEIRRRGGTRMCSTYEADETGPGPFYARLGLRPTGANERRSDGGCTRPRSTRPVAHMSR